MEDITPDAGPARPGAPDARPGLPPADHEHSDVNVRAILLFGAALIVVAVVIHAGVWLLFEGFESRAAAADPRPAPLALPAGQLPPSPRLQTRPVDELKALRADEEALLTTEAPVDGQPGVYRIPIERAKQLVVERGLPTRQTERAAR